MSSAARARLSAMRGAPAPKSRAVTAAAARLTSAIRRQNAMAGRRTGGRLRRRNAMTAGYLGIELKYQDMWVAYTNIAAPVTPNDTIRFNPSTNQGTPAAPVNVAIGCMNAVCQGDGPWNRDGKKIRLRSLYIKGSIYRPSVGASGANLEPFTVYCACVLDKQPNGAEISPAQVWVNPGGQIASNACYLRHLEYNDRYRILKDQVFTLPSQQVANGANYSTGSTVRHFEWFIPLNFDTLFNTTTPTSATIASIVTNAIGFCAVASQNSAGNQVALVYTARLRFVG